MRELTIDSFLRELSSSAPVPGGGGASALMGAVSSSLCSMVGNLTTGKKKYAQYQDDIEAILAKASVLTEEMTVLIEKDAEAFEPLSKAYSIPKEQEGRDEIIETALRTASDAPFEIIMKALEITELIDELSVKGSRLAISDVGVAASALRACASGAAMNVYINTKLMKDRIYAEEMNSKTAEAVNAVCSISDRVYMNVLQGLK